jgi:membrane protein YdbS with pleckstrin-like domain
MLKKYRLPNQIENEEIIKVVRMDFFILFTKILLFMLLSVLPLLFFSLVAYINIGLFTGPLSGPIIVLSASAFYLFACLLFFFSFIDYYLDIWIITNERIIDIQQRGFFSRVISEQKLFRIQDVTSEVHGIIPTLLHFGDVHVQTAGTKERFFFNDVPNPDEIRDIIIKLVRLNQQKHKAEIIAEVLPPADIKPNGEVQKMINNS